MSADRSASALEKIRARRGETIQELAESMFQIHAQYFPGNPQFLTLSKEIRTMWYRAAADKIIERIR